jgi:hypothetical protein
VLLGEKYLHVAEQLGLIRGRKAAEYRKISLYDDAPCLRELLLAKTLPPPLGAKAKDHTQS